MIKILELFAGIGACSKALTNLDIEHRIVDAVEIDKFAIRSFNAIHDTSFEPQDIREWDKNIEVDLIMHGSPCQDFSIAGRGAGGDKNSGTRSSLMYETLRIVEKLMPKFVIWENVPNILSAKHKHNFDAYLSAMEHLGYSSRYQVLNAKDYGVPQNRKRVFTVSILNPMIDNFKFPNQTDGNIDIEKMFDLPKEVVKDNERQRRVYSTNGISPTILNRTDSPKIVDFKFPKAKPLTNRLADILEDKVEEKYYLNDEQVSKFKVREVSQTIRTSGRGSIDRIIKVGDLDIKGNDQIKRVYSDKGVSPTLNTMQGGHRQPKIVASRGRGKNNVQRIEPRKDELTNSLTTVQKDNYVIGAPLRIRKLTPKECWRLMGFSDTGFENAQRVNSNTQLYKQAGNSIVVNVLEAILTNLLLRKEVE